MKQCRQVQSKQPRHRSSKGQWGPLFAWPCVRSMSEYRPPLRLYRLRSSRWHLPIRTKGCRSRRKGSEDVGRWDLTMFRTVSHEHLLGQTGHVKREDDWTAESGCSSCARATQLNIALREVFFHLPQKWARVPGPSEDSAWKLIIIYPQAKHAEYLFFSRNSLSQSDKVHTDVWYFQVGLKIFLLNMKRAPMEARIITQLGNLGTDISKNPHIDLTSSSRASRGRKFQKKKEVYSKERICL